MIRSRGRDVRPLTAPLRRGSVVESVYGIGTITARKIFNLKLGVTSTVRKLDIVEGDHVQKGQALMDLEGIGATVAPFD